MSSSAQWPALGDSKAAAAVCAAAFFVMALLSIMNKRLTGYRLYLIGGGLAGIFRGVSMAIKASTISKGESNEGTAITSFFFAGAGFGIAIAVQLLVLAGWLRNTSEDAKPSFWRPLRLLLIAGLFPPVIVFGPILGLTAGLVQWTDTPPSQHAVDVANQLRETSATGMLIIVSVSSLVSMLCLATAVRARGGFSLRRHASHSIVWLVPGTLLLVWSATFRVQSVWVRPWSTYDESLLYPLQVLPELLQLMLWCVPTLMARVHLSDRFQPWWKEGHPEGPEAPPGGFATEPQTPGGLDSEQSSGAQATLTEQSAGGKDGAAGKADKAVVLAVIV